MNLSFEVQMYQVSASEKFDYFITGLTGALCAYISQTFIPQKLSCSPQTIELISLLILVGSVVCGFKRIETNLQHYKITGELLVLEEEKLQLNTLLYSKDRDISKPLINQTNGREFTRDQAHERISDLSIKIEKHADLQIECGEESGKWYSRRNLALMVGFLTLLIAKVLLAYV